MPNTVLHNPHLDGAPFFWRAGETGVLLTHGLTATPVEIKGLAGCLHAAGYTTSGPLLPGHAETPAALNQTRWQDWYGVVETAYREITGRCARVFVGGESTGGALSLLLAARNPSIAGVLVYAPALKMAFSPLQARMLPLLCRLVASTPKPNVEKDPYWQGYTVNPLKAVRELQKLQAVLLPELRAVRQPLLVVQGRLDTTISLESANIAYNGVSSAVKELHWLDRSRHCLLLDEERDEAVRLTLEFLRRN